MVHSPFFQEQLQGIIRAAAYEDVAGEGDWSSLACIDLEAQGRAKLLVKDKGIIAGVDFAKQVFNFIDKDLQLKIFIQDGGCVDHGAIVLKVQGRVLSILKAERIVLNAMQRMSAIATKTHRYVSLLKGTKAQLLDTRKTTPCIRALEKWAVLIGGGANHRFGLYDTVMLKDNHIDFVGSISKAVEKTKQYLERQNKTLKIIVEARDLNEVQEILRCKGVHRILLDNFNHTDTKKAVAMIGDFCQTESSGNIHQENIRAYALCGVDYISCGSLTHSVHNMDLSLKSY